MALDQGSGELYHVECGSDPIFSFARIEDDTPDSNAGRLMLLSMQVFLLRAVLITGLAAW